MKTIIGSSCCAREGEELAQCTDKVVVGVEQIRTLVSTLLSAETLELWKFAS